MIQTRFYEPIEPQKFWKNIQRRWYEYSDRVAHYNSEQSISMRTNGELIYHVLDASVFIRRPNETHMVGITANIEKGKDKIEEARKLLEEIAKQKIIEAF